jgi:hypothetical protein
LSYWPIRFGGLRKKHSMPPSPAPSTGKASRFALFLFNFFVALMFFAKFAVFFQFQTVRRISFVFPGRIVSLFTFQTC